MTKEDFLHLAFDFRFLQGKKSSEIKKGLSPGIIKCSGFYESNKENIKKILNISTIEEIVKVLSVSEDLSFKEIEKILGIEHPTMWEHIKRLEDLKLVTKEKKKLEGGRRAYKLNLNKNIKVSHLFVYEGEEIVEEKKDGSKIVDVVTTSNLETLKKMGFKNIKSIVNNENVNKIFEKYISEAKERLEEKQPKRIEKGEAKNIETNLKNEKIKQK